MRSHHTNMKRIWIYLLLSIGLLSSCEKMLDVDSTRLVSEENMWEKMEDSRAAILGVYALCKSALSDHNAIWLYGEVRSGEFSIPTRQDLKAIGSNDLKAPHESVLALQNWRRWYAVVNSATIFLERINEVKAKDERYTENNMIVDKAQARFLRAYAYFNMVRIWGDVPLITNSDEGTFMNKSRENKDKVLAWVEQEMQLAAKDLPFRYSANDEQQMGNYYNEGSSRWDGALASKISAYAMMAHVAAWQANYPDASAYSKFVLDNYQKANINYASTSNLTSANGFFYDKHSSQMFSFPNVWNHVEASFKGHLEELTLASPVVDKSIPDMYLPKASIIEIFNELGDERFSIDTLGNPFSEAYFQNFNGRYPIFSKIKCIQGGVTDPTFRIYSSAIVITRLEDVLLLRAESLAALGERSGAIELLNTMRERRGLDNYNEEKNGDLIDMIFQERNRELMGEGHRWYDLVRYHKLKNEDKNFTDLISNGGIYWPIAEDLLQQNSLLKQNDFWN